MNDGYYFLIAIPLSKVKDCPDVVALSNRGKTVFHYGGWNALGKEERDSVMSRCLYMWEVQGNRD